MPRGPNDKKFEADIPRTMWDAFETWAQHRGPINNRQLCQALFRLFLAAPEGVKLLALYGRGDQLEMAARSLSSSCRHPRSGRDRLGQPPLRQRPPETTFGRRERAAQEVDQQPSQGRNGIVSLRPESEQRS